MMEQLERLGELLAKGGFVMPPLVAGGLLVWFLLGYRFVMLFLGDRREVRVLVQAALEDRILRPSGVLARAAIKAAHAARRPPKHLRPVLDEILYEDELELRRFSTAASAIVRSAPLLGLLGTVAGMISTFDALGDTSSASNAGTGVAGGISEALFSTQLGLLVAIPGLLIGRMLDRQQAVLEGELQRLKDLVALELDGGLPAGEVPKS